MSLSTSAIADLHWWLKHLKNTNQPLQDIPVDCTIQADTSEQGLGATDGNTPIGGRWSSLERNHIHVLELKATFALNSYFRHNCNFKHIHILTDNSTALACINNTVGMHSDLCNYIAKRIWEIAQNRGFWISSSQIPGAENAMADKMSRVFSDNTEWMLSIELFKILCDKFQFSPQVDLFATRLNKHIDKYVSWMPDPYCIAVNILNFSWKTHKIYAFPPFNLVGAVISKRIRDNTIGIMIIPKWTTQHWFPTMIAHLIDHPIQLPSGLKMFSLPSKPSQALPLSPKLQLLLVITSGIPLHSSVFQEKLKKPSSQSGNLKLLQNTNLSLTDGKFFEY